METARAAGSLVGPLIDSSAVMLLRVKNTSVSHCLSWPGAESWYASPSGTPGIPIGASKARSSPYDLCAPYVKVVALGWSPN